LKRSELVRYIRKSVGGYRRTPVPLFVFCAVQEKASVPVAAWRCAHHEQLIRGYGEGSFRAKLQ
jgi:hypothetical protein